ASHPGWVADRDRERTDIATYGGAHADHGARPDPAVLVHHGSQAEICMCPDVRVPGELDRGGQHHAVVQYHVVRHVASRQQHGVVANTRGAAGALVDAHELANLVAVADD